MKTLLQRIYIITLASFVLGISPLAHAEHHGKHAGCCQQKEASQQAKIHHGKARGLYQQWCARCHGSLKGDGLIGPNLVESADAMSKEEFYEIVINGRKTATGNMPAWKSNPRVMGNIDDLYDFIKAHSNSDS